jgi:hypothetical protein
LRVTAYFALRAFSTNQDPALVFIYGGLFEF